MELQQELTNSKICCHTISFDKGLEFFHWHESFEICRVEKKNCTFRIDGKLYPAKEGDIVVIPPHIAHQFIIEEDGTDILVLQFPLKLLLHLGEDALPLIHHIKCDEFSTDSIFSERLEALLQFMLQEHFVAENEENPLLSSFVVSFYLLLQSRFAEREEKGKKGRKDFFKIVDYINLHFTEEINQNALASALYMSRGKLAEVFKRYSGISVNDYINTLRINRVNQLLKSGHTATEAALTSGFSTIRTFNNVYKTVMNMTPTEYLNQK